MRFIDVHSGPAGISKEQFAHEHAKDLAIQDQESVRFLHAWADPESGKMFCLSEAPNKEAVLKIHEQAGHPADDIYEVPLEVE